MIDYSEDFLARIDTPVLDHFSMTFFLDLVFDVPHLEQFMPPKAASVLFDIWSIRLDIGNQCDRIDWQVDSMARALVGLTATEVLPNLCDLFLEDLRLPELYWKPCSHFSPHDSSPVNP
ncbi:hypothetical protein BC826DRAFT_1057232 [Russula brevipes]|nr:hypothetical protein BC826DRAFT_1057232 [Russula brevipes]